MQSSLPPFPPVSSPASANRIQDAQPDRLTPVRTTPTAPGNTVLEPLPRWKRGLDLACCVAALPVLGVTSFVAAAVTSVMSPGPLFFKQPAIGLHGHRVWMYRLRTMHVSRAQSVTGFSAMRSPYYIGGRFLSATGLAKLPQIVNVWRGEISMFGSRGPAAKQRIGFSI